MIGVGVSSLGNDGIESGIESRGHIGRVFLWRAAFDKLVEDGPDGENIGSMIDGILAGVNFRRGVAWGPKCHGFEPITIDLAGETEVANLGSRVGIEKNVGWFDVAVENAASMSVSDSARDFGN